MRPLKFIALATASICLLSCSDNDDNPTPVNEEEVITTVKVTLVNGENTIILQSQDLDGDGPNAPVITVSGDLAANTTYMGSAEFLNELENPAENFTEEILEEGVDHQLFYQLSNSLGTVTYDDADDNGNPIGLQFSLATGNAGSGSLTVVLKHEPNKTAAGVKDGDITNAGGSTDAEVSFPVTIQ